MRLKISHETIYRYETPPASVIDVLRLTPWTTANQSVRSWRISVSNDALLYRADDAFGNIGHTFTLDNPPAEITILALGTVETEEHTGVLTGTRERLPVGAYLRETPLTAVTPTIAALGERAKNGSTSVLDHAHRLNALTHESMTVEAGRSRVAIPADAALSAGRGACQDLAHVFVAAARASGLPARYVAGYYYVDEGARDDEAGHAWTEAFVPELGWVTFDPSTGMSATSAYVRTAIGLDALGAAPVRGSIYGGTGETLTVRLAIEGPATPEQSPGGTTLSQSQSQSWLKPQA